MSTDATIQHLLDATLPSAVLDPEERVGVRCGTLRDLRATVARLRRAVDFARGEAARTLDWWEAGRVNDTIDAILRGDE